MYVWCGVVSRRFIGWDFGIVFFRGLQRSNGICEFVHWVGLLFLVLQLCGFLVARLSCNKDVKLISLERILFESVSDEF